MRLLIFLFLANPAIANPWLDGPTPTERTRRANIEEASDRTSPSPSPSTKAKAGCEKCGLDCECGPGCQCGADYWKDYCKAVPDSHRQAFMRSLIQSQAYYQPMYYMPQSYGGFGAMAGDDCGVPGG